MHLSKRTPGHLHDYDRGPSDYAGDSNNSNSFWYHTDITNGRYIYLLGRYSDRESSLQCEDSDRQICQNSLGLVGEGNIRIHIDMFIIDNRMGTII